MSGGLVEQDLAFLVRGWRGAAQFLAEVDAAFHRRAVAHCSTPASDIRELLDRLAQGLGDQHPWPRTHVSDRVFGAEDVLAALQPAFEHAETAIVLVLVALQRIRVLARRV